MNLTLTHLSYRARAKFPRAYLTPTCDGILAWSTRFDADTRRGRRIYGGTEYDRMQFHHSGLFSEKN